MTATAITAMTVNGDFSPWIITISNRYEIPSILIIKLIYFKKS